jgi:Leucine-rich repeat (LRR) protein
MRTTLTQKKSSHKTSSNTTMMDPKIALIVSMGYSVGQAKQALAENNGDVDDAIDDLFLKGRLKARNITTTAAFNDDDVTVTDSLPPTNNSAGALFRPTPAIPLMAMRFANRNVQKNAPSNSPSQGRPIQENCKEDFDACPFPAKSALESDGAVSAVDRVSDNLEPDPIFKSLTPSAIPEDMPSPEKSGFGTFDEKAGDSSNLPEESSELSERHQTPNVVHASVARPGAFAVAGIAADQDSDTYQGTDELVTVSGQHSLANIEAEVVDPDVENQILEQRVQRELKREREKAAVAQIVDEEEFKTCRWRRVACVIGVMLVAFAIALGVSLKFARPPPTDDASVPPPDLPPQEMFDLIAPVSFDEGASLLDPWSPQSAAARWLAHNTNLENYTVTRKLQRYAMATLYYSTNGDEWKDNQEWLSDSNECTDWWVTDFVSESKMLSCDANNAITLLLIEDNNLVGTIPDEIALLSDSMVELKLKGNVLQGTLPSTFGFMTRLKDLLLWNNDITGHIPTEFGLLTALTDLSLNENQLSGSIPTEFALLSSLEDLHLQTNHLVGTISPTIGSLTRLNALTLAENNLTNFIPTEIGLLTLLGELALERNALLGPIPSEIGGLKAMELFSCYENFLTGSLPTELGRLEILKRLRVAGNRLTGSIPSEFSQLTTLEQLRLEYNLLTGTILSSIGEFPNMNRLELKYNRLSGTIPETLGQLTLMEHLRLQVNNLTGTISEKLTQFSQAKYLGFSNNSLTGTLPPFVNSTRLKYFNAGYNMLTGTIPASVTQLWKLEELLISNNALTGTIPSLNSLQNLEIVELFNNSFVGNFTCPPKVVDCYISCFVPNKTACRSLN